MNEPRRIDKLPRKPQLPEEEPRMLSIEELIERSIMRGFDRLNARVRELVDYDEAAGLLSMSKSSFTENLIDTGELIPVRGLDSKPRVRIDDLRALIERKQGKSGKLAS